MSSNALDQLNQPIVAIGCRDNQENLHFIHYDKDPIYMSNLDVQEESVHVDNLIIPLKWYNAVLMCTEEQLEEMKNKLA